jgi:hypothetical protein
MDECIYNTVNAQDLLSALGAKDNDTDTQNRILTSMLVLSAQNCNNFRSRVFAFRANSGSFGAVTGALLASGGAITALVSGPVAAGLSGASAAVTASITGVNNNFYSNYGMGELDQKIITSRATMRDCIEKRMAAIPGEASTDSSCTTRTSYSAEDKLSDLQQYDSLCSLELAASNPLATPSPSPSATRTAAGAAGSSAVAKPGPPATKSSPSTKVTPAAPVTGGPSGGH